MTDKHGGDIYKRNIIYDFSANTNPFGMPEGVKKALISSVDKWNAYPDPFCRALKEKISEKTGVDPDKIVCGNGAADLIYRIVRTVDPKKAVVSAPTFSEYEKALLESKCSVSRYYTKEENDFEVKEDILELLCDDTDMLVLCSPNNPTGMIIERDILKKICEKCFEKDIVFLCDECFMEFVKNGESFSAMNFINKNVIILKAFTKIYAMAGLRLGYAVFDDASLAEKTAENGQYWSVGTPAQIAGIAALDEKLYIEKTVATVEKERLFMVQTLKELGFKVYPSKANFILFKATSLLTPLLSPKHIQLRNCGNYEGLTSDYYRTAIKLNEQNNVLLNALSNL